MRLIPGPFQRGGPVAQVGSDWFNLVTDWLNRLQGAGCEVDRSGPYPVIRVPLTTPSIVGRQLWSLSNPTTDSVDILGSAYGLCAGGSWYSVDSGTVELGINDTWIYLVFDRDGSVTLATGDTIPSAIDAKEYFPLWELVRGEDGTPNLTSSIRMCGGAIHVTYMA